MAERTPMLPALKVMVADDGDLRGLHDWGEVWRKGEAELRAAEACIRELKAIRKARGHGRTFACLCSMCRALDRLDREEAVSRAQERKFIREIITDVLADLRATGRLSRGVEDRCHAALATLALPEDEPAPIVCPNLMQATGWCVHTGCYIEAAAKQIRAPAPSAPTTAICEACGGPHLTACCRAARAGRTDE